MREIRTSGSVGGRGLEPPRPTRPASLRPLTSPPLAWWTRLTGSPTSHAPCLWPRPASCVRRCSQVPRRVFTVDGWMDLEREYVPRVVTRENGAAAPEALKAQAVAARTYVLRAMRDNATLGTPARPLPNSQSFQTYASVATPACMAAAKVTARIVATYQNELTFANYVAGALWSASGEPSSDPTNTERWVTYNQGKHGEAVTPTKLAAAHKANRGCMSQNGAHWLALHGYANDQILRFFYGADVELRNLRAIELPQPASRRATEAGGAILMLAGAALFLLSERRSI